MKAKQAKYTQKEVDCMREILAATETPSPTRAWLMAEREVNRIEKQLNDEKTNSVQPKATGTVQPPKD